MKPILLFIPILMMCHACFEFPRLAKVSTSSVKQVTVNTAQVEGKIEDEGEGISSYGHCWSVNNEPTLDQKTTYNTDIYNGKIYTSTLNNLEPGTRYYVRSYAITQGETVYGSTETFQTTTEPSDNPDPEITLPVIETGSIKNITATTAEIEATVTDNGNDEDVLRGVCWNTAPEPTIDDHKVNNGTGSGKFTSSLNDLEPNTTYYVRAYATNNEGTSYGEQENFTTLEESDGGDTEVVEVTNPTTGKTWMDRNLGASRAAISSTDEQAYGDLYQWGRAADGHEKRTSGTTSTLSSTDTPSHDDFILAPSSPYDWRSPQNDNFWQGVSGTNNPCPSGYRLPTEAEWEAERTSWSSNNAAGAFASPLKLPVAGGRYGSTGSLDDVGSSGFYWSTTVVGANSRDLYFFSSGTTMLSGYRAAGLSVRCLKDETSITNTPQLTTSAVSSITDKSAKSGGNITDDGGASVTARGVVWSTSENPTVETNEGMTTDGTGTGEFTSSLTGLTAETTYYVRAYATNSEGTSYGEQESFTTLAESGGGDTEVVEVTNPATGKTWMDRNLGASRAATSSTDADAYGDLYQWGRAADGHEKRNSGTTSTLSSADTPGHDDFILVPSSPFDWRSPQNDNLWQGVSGTNNPCPSGYRLPTEAEWEAERQSWSNNNAAGAFASPLKLPVAGLRNVGSGSLSNVGLYGYYWSSTVNSPYYSRNLELNSINAVMNGYVRALGISVRCLKD